MRIGITKKIIIFFTLLNLAIASTSAYVVYREHSDLLVKKALLLLEKESSQIEKSIHSSINNHIRNVLFLAATPPIQGIIRARNANGIDPIDGSTEAIWIKRLETIFKQFTNLHPDYFQVRYIGVDDGGMELVRVERQHKKSFIVHKKDLQRKGQTDYFKKTIEHSPGRSYLSSINLNREHGEISKPHTRTLRIAVPVHNSANKIFGLLVLNVDVGPLLDKLQIATNSPYLINKDGNFLIHPDKNRTFAFEFGTEYTLQDENSQWSQLIRSQRSMETGAMQTKITGDTVLLFGWMSMSSNHPEQSLGLLVVLPTNIVLKDIVTARKMALLITLFLVLVGSVLVYFFSYRLTRPLTRIIDAVDSFKEGDKPVIFSLKARDEIGNLAKSFERMTLRIYEDAKNLRERERRITAIMNTAVDGIIIIDHNGIVQSCNPTVETLFGYSSEEIIGKNVSLLMHSQHRKQHDSYINNYLITGDKKVIGFGGRELIARHKDGTDLDLELSISEFRVDEKFFFTGILHDISERKEAEHRLRKAHDELEVRVDQRTKSLQEVNKLLMEEAAERQKAEERLRLTAKVFENTSEAIVITHPDGNIVEINQAYCDISGYSREELIGKNPRVNKSNHHDKAFYQDMWRRILESGTWTGEIWDRRKNGELYPKWLTINAVKNDQNATSHYVGIFSDITEVKHTEKKLEQLAYNDALTGLPNRSLFRERLEHSIVTAKRQRSRLAVMFIDLDRFKQVNDTFGHAAGDKLLKIVAQRLTSCVRNADTVARLGGDEFTIIITDIEDVQGVTRACLNILEEIPKPMEVSGQEVFVETSIGISLFPEDGEDFDTLTKNADVAMYQSKKDGRNKFTFFADNMNERTSRRLALEAQLRHGIARNEFQLYYQPKVDFSTGMIVSMEALVRWNHPDEGLISPVEFIPLAEETNLILPLGQLIFEMACRQMRKWVDAGYGHLCMAVNLSPIQFKQESLIENIRQILDETGLDPNLLELEITESVVVDGVEEAIVILTKIREMGLHIAMDDFGAGYSSLSYIKRLPIETLKIDQSFVRDLTIDSDDATIVTAIIAMAKNLDMKVVAEGVETKEQADFLRSKDCGMMQGYYYSKPLPPEEFFALLEEEKKLE
jgi:diguanylate cyclase (GGDEF)-like protein/PAS domain S-box-containing protein